LLCPELIDPFLIESDHLRDVRSILAVDAVGFANPTVDIENLVYLHVRRLHGTIRNNGPHVVLTLALCTAREVESFLYGRLPSKTVQAKKVVARQLNGVLKNLEADTAAHFFI
jgi:hypothetical protein